MGEIAVKCLIDQTTGRPLRALYFATAYHRGFAQERQAAVAREAKVVVGELHAAAGEALERVILGDMYAVTVKEPARNAIMHEIAYSLRYIHKIPVT